MQTARWRRPLGGALTALIALATLSACGSSSTNSTNSPAASSGGKTKCPVNVLVVTNITGAGAQNGQAGEETVKYTVGQINKAGGVLGCPIHADIKDEASDPTKDVPLVEEAVSQKKYAEVIVSDFGAGSAVPYLTREKILNITAIGAGLGNPKINPYFFDMTPVLGNTVQYAVKQAVVNNGHKKLAAIVQDSDLGNNSAAGIAAAAKRYGAQVTDVERVDETAVDFTAALQRAKNSGADALIIDVAGAAAGHILTDRLTLGWTVPTYGGLGLFAANIAATSPPAAYKGLDLVGPTVGTYPNRPVVQQFINGLKAAGATAAFQANLLEPANFHDDLILFAWAANQTKSLDAATISDFLQTHGNTPVPGLIYGVTTGFSPTSHENTGEGTLASAAAGPFKDGQLKRIAVLN
jgi:branched-chain amino acid transport system substrate-binding protein